MKECKFYFRELVYVDFGDHKIIGEVQSHRITKEHILYNIHLVNMYVPPTMIHKLTKEQEKAYFELMNKHGGGGNIELFIEEMQEIFKETKIEFENGSVIESIGTNGDNVRGKRAELFKEYYKTIGREL